MFKKIFSKIIIILLCLPFLAFQIKNIKKELTLNPLFSNHIVLQQNEKATIWGENTPNKKVTVLASWGKSSVAKTDSKGNWKLTIETPKGGGPYTISVSSNNSEILLTDVLIGEVWLASGQSNMEMPVKGWRPNDVINNSHEEITNGNYQKIRMFTVEKGLSLTPLNTVNGTWKVCNTANVSDFSATAYFFARRLYKELNVPIGIIHSSWGGTVSEAWTSKEKLKKLGDFDEVLNSISSKDKEQDIIKWFSKWESVAIPKTTEQWNALNLNDVTATTPTFNDVNWSTIHLPGRYDDALAGEVDGAFWFRKKVVIENISTDYKIYLGAIDDKDATYVNGFKIGGLAGDGVHASQRVFTIPKNILKKGENTIAIRAIDTGGPGTFTGQMYLDNGVDKEILIDGEWKYMLVAEMFDGKFFVYNLDENDFINRAKIFKIHANVPTVLYNAMLKPLVPYTIKGAIWYQGEANVGRAEQYKRIFPAMIDDWREQWKSYFPFYFVQIAPFKYHQNNETFDQSQKLRNAQRVSLKTKNTGMVVTMDIGNYTNIHPANKQDVGSRLAGLALANDYKKQLVASGPMYKSCKQQNTKLIIDFDFKGSGLLAKDNLAGFEIASEDKNYVPATAKIVNNKIELSAASIKKPKYARYAWRDNGKATLFNKEGLPASTFTTEK